MIREKPALPRAGFRVLCGDAYLIDSRRPGQFSGSCQKGLILGVKKKLAKRDTPEERELSQKLEKLSNFQLVLTQRE